MSFSAAARLKPGKLVVAAGEHELAVRFLNLADGGHVLCEEQHVFAPQIKSILDQGAPDEQLVPAVLIDLQNMETVPPPFSPIRATRLSRAKYCM